MPLNKYRIYRTDPKNLTIQKNEGKRWITISYHGNSLDSLISGLFSLIIQHHTPDRNNIYDALVEAKLEMIKGIDDIREMVKRDCKEL